MRIALGLPLILVAQILGCSTPTAEAPPCDRPSIGLQEWTFGALASESSATFRFTPPRVDRPFMGVHLTFSPEGSPMRLAVSREPCALVALSTGACGSSVGPSSTGHLSFYPDLEPGTRYEIYATNLGTEVVSGELRIAAYDRLCPCWSCLL